MQLTRQGPGVVRLEGQFQNAQVTAVLRRAPDSALVLMSRGFHWTSEYPYNRKSSRTLTETRQFATG